MCDYLRGCKEYVQTRYGILKGVPKNDIWLEEQTTEEREEEGLDIWRKRRHGRSFEDGSTGTQEEESGA